VDFNEWLDFGLLGDEKGKLPAQENQVEEETAGKKEMTAEEMAAAVEAILEDGVESKEEGELIDLDIICSEEFSNFLTHVDEANKIAETLYIYLKTYNIGFLYLITDSSYISMTKLEDLESRIAQGDENAKKELLAQYEILNDQLRQIKGIRREKGF